MAIPTIINDLRNNERKYLISQLDNHPFIDVESDVYANILSVSFILSILEKVDNKLFARNVSFIEHENILSRATLTRTIMEEVTSSKFGLALFNAYQAGAKIGPLRKVGTNLTLIGISPAEFSDSIINFTTDTGVEYTLSGGAWSGGDELVMFKVNGVIMIANSSAVMSLG